jgi:hypothetical protein
MAMFNTESITGVVGLIRAKVTVEQADDPPNPARYSALGVRLGGDGGQACRVTLTEQTK